MAEGGTASIETEQTIPSPHTEQEATPEQDATPEQEATPEQKRGHISVGAARLIAGIYDRKYLNPAKQTIPEAEKTAFAENLKRTRSVDIDFAAIADISVNSRLGYWNQEASMNFKAQNNKWNHQVHMWLEENLKDDAAPAEVLRERKAALKSLGLGDPAKDEQNENTKLYGAVETFRKKYFGETSNVRGFVDDLVNDCPKNSDGAIDMDVLQKRLVSISDVLNAFGKDEEIHILIREYATVAGLLSDKPSKKAAYVEDIASLLDEDVQNPTLKSAFQRLLEKHNEITKEDEEKQKKEEKAKDTGKGEWNDTKIKEEVDKAQKDAQLKKDVISYTKELSRLREEFQRGQKSFEEYTKDVDRLDASLPNINKGIIEAPTRDDYIKLMRAAKLPEQQIFDDLMHEDDHVKILTEAGIKPVYTLRLEKEENGDIIGHSRTTYDDPMGWSEDEIRKLHDRFLMGPGLEHISPVDRQGLGISDEQYDMAKSIKKRFALVNMSSDEELAFIRNIKEEKEKIKNKLDVSRLPTQERPTADEQPDEFIDDEKMYNRFVESAINGLKALNIYDANQHSPAEFANKLEAIGGKDKYNAENWRKVLMQQTPPEVSVIPATSIDALITAAKNGDAVIIPYNETHLGVIEPGENCLYQGGKSGEISVKLYTPGAAEPTYISLEALLDSELPLYDAAEGEAHERYQDKSRAFILRKNTL